MGTEIHAAEMLAALDLIADKRPRVLVWGDSCLDRYVEVERRENPEGDGPRYRAIAGQAIIEHIGMAGAVAGQCLAMGAAVELLAAAWPPAKTRYVHRGDVACTIDDDKHVRSTLREKRRNRMLQLLDDEPPPAAVAIVDYQKGVLDGVVLPIVLRRCNRLGIPVVVEAHNATNYDAYAGATVIKAQERAVTPGMINAFWPTSPDTEIMLTCGERGINAGRVGAFKARTVREGDTTGCGDIVTGVLACCLAVGIALPTACRLANVAAGLKVGKRGAVPTTAAEIRAEIGRMSAEALTPGPSPARGEGS